MTTFLKLALAVSLGLACLASWAAAQADTAAAVSDPAATVAAPDSIAPVPQTVPAAPGPIVVAGTQTAPVDGRFAGGHLLFVEGLFFYTRWKEEPLYYYTFDPAYQPPTYEYSSRTVAAIASYSYVFPKGLAIGGSFGLMTISTSRKLLSGQSYYYSGDSKSSSSINLIGPRVGYYYMRGASRVTPYIAAEYDVISGSYGFSQNMLRVGAGALVRIAPTAAISFGVDYVDISEQNNATNILGLVGMIFIFK